MRIQTKDIIAGQPALKIRKLLHYTQDSESNTVTTIMRQLNIDSLNAEKVFLDLISEGYITTPAENDEIWHNTITGNALANATARKPITRRTAERLIQEFLNRVKEINACDDYVYRIKQVIIFGSYLSDSSNIGDIDLWFDLEYRYKDSKKREKQARERVDQAKQKGRNFRSYLDELFWPYKELLLLLKAHSPSISLHNEEAEKALLRSVPSKVLFDIKTDKHT